MNWSNEWVKNEVEWVEGYYVGDLIVHKGEDILGWIVSHKPTEASFMSAVPANETWKPYTKQELIDWCTKVQQRHTWYWGAIRALTPDNYEDNLKDARYHLREWCLSVEIRNKK